MKLATHLSSHKLTALAVALAFSAAACTQKSADTTEPAAPAGTDPVAAPAPAPASTEGLAVFSSFTGSLPAEAPSKECALDRLDGEAPASPGSFEAGSSAALGGWAGNGAGQVARNFQLVLKGTTQSFATAIQPSVPRPDVSTALNAPGLENSGYTLNISLAGVPAGDYAMYLVDPSNPESTLCDLKYAFNLK